MKTTLINALLLAVGLALPATALAQKAQPEPLPSLLTRNWEVREATPNAALGEVQVLKEYSDGALYRVNTTFKDQRRLVEEFFPDGHKKGETECFADGTIKIRRFREDGKGLMQERILTRSKGLEEINYRPDGKTKWTRSVWNKQNQVEYFNEKGVLKLRRDFTDNRAKMTVLVFDDTGKVLYEQVWMYTPSGFKLQLVIENTATGTARRRIFMKNGTTVDSIDYLKPDGTVAKSESGAQMSEPALPERLRELNPKDDPTAPRAASTP